MTHYTNLTLNNVRNLTEIGGFLLMETALQKENSAFEYVPYERTVMPKSKRYTKEELEVIKLRDQRNFRRTFRLKNFLTGEREEVILTPPHVLREHIEESQDGFDFVPAELTADITRAMKTFNRQQRLVLVDVLIKGLSLEKVVKTRKESYSWWYNWLTHKALPRLRANLAEYYKDGKVVLR